MDETSAVPDYNEVTYKQRTNFKLIKCNDLGITIYPFEKVWDRTHWNCGGAIVGAPPIQITNTISDKAYMLRVLKETNNG